MFVPRFIFSDDGPYIAEGNDQSVAIREVRDSYKYNDSRTDYVGSSLYNSDSTYEFVKNVGYLPQGIKKEYDEKTGLYYFVDKENGKDTITISNIDESVKIAEIPAQINGLTVTRIADSAFLNSNLQSISFEQPDNIVSIGMYSFMNCSNLEKITIPNNVKIIQQYTFKNNIKLVNVNFPTNLFRIDTFAFDNCRNINNVIIPSSVSTIERYAFNCCWISTDGSITFKRTYSIERYDANLIFNDDLVTIYVPREKYADYKTKFPNQKNILVNE